MDRADKFINIGCGDIQKLLFCLDLVETPLMDSVRNVNEEEAKKTKEKRNFSIEHLEYIEELVRKVRAFMIYFNAHDFGDLYNKITNIYIERFEHLKTIDRDTDKEIFYEWVPEDAKRTFNEMNREREGLLSWLDFGHPLYIYEWRKKINKQHDKIIEGEEEPEEVEEVDLLEQEKTNSNTIQEKKENTHFDIKPIETKYKGIKFRSRAEARWAVFFDACGIKWDYEPEGYVVGDNLCYLPDFLIHNVGIRGSEKDGQTFDLYIEVKGSNKITSEEIEKIDKFSAVTNEEDREDWDKLLKNKKNILVVGSVPQNLEDMRALNNEDNDFYSFKYIDEDTYQLYLCVKDNQLLLRGSDTNYMSDIYETKYEKELEEKLAIARSARFEFGETSNIKNKGE